MRNAFLVEDDEAVRAALSEALLALADTQVVGWSGSEEGALAWLARHPGMTDVVVLDLFLDAGSGLGALARLRKLPVPPRVIVLSSGATSLLRRSCMLLGAEAVYDKASNLDAFYAYLLSIPDRKRPQAGAAASADRSSQGLG